MVEGQNTIHGEFSVNINQDIVVVGAKGPWNLECVVEFGKEYAAKASSLFGQNWADIVLYGGESLFVPDAESLLKSKIEIAIQAGLTHVAIVVGKSTVKTIARMQINQIYRDLNIHYQIFDSVEDAAIWIGELGLKFDKGIVENALNTIDVLQMESY